MLPRCCNKSLLIQFAFFSLSFFLPVKELNSYLLLIFQFVVSVATGFVFGFFAPYLLYGIEEVGRRMLLGIVLAFVVGIADLYFIVRTFLEEEGVINLRERVKKLQ